MDNYEIADTFSLMGKLMDIHGENSFKSRSYSIAAFHIEKIPEQLSSIEKDKIAGIKGIGDSSAKKIIELLETGKLKILQEILEKTPAGIIEMMQVKGIGPKKIFIIWKEMGIESIGELLYACEENRLKTVKGFGEKTQQNIIENIQFYLNNQGSFLYQQAEPFVPQIKGYLEKLFGAGNVLLTGNFLRQMETIDELEFIINSSNDLIKPKFQSAFPPELLQETTDSLLYKLTNGLRLRLYTGTENMQQRLFNTSASNEFIQAFTEKFTSVDFTKVNIEDDKSVFQQAGLAYIPVFLRESAMVIDLAQEKKIPEVIQPADIKAIIHCHSNWSDGSDTIENMAKAAAEKGLQYMVISDHSKAAFYAQGLSEERIKEQHHYIDELNSKYPSFKIFKSIECDILNDGQLDYSDSILSTFDLVITSVHSNLKMTEEKAMQRLIKAIENPYTTILGHMTGRLLLSRKGYPVDHKKIIDACAANSVVIELNAHPRRLDMDWRWLRYAVDKNVLISIDPDSHAIEGYSDTRYGVLVAQKAMITKEQNLSSFSLKDFEHFLATQKLKRN
ncbi:MAG: helix-hairpin-helix domain-containing protein [Ferruginibacter sp.]